MKGSTITDCESAALTEAVDAVAALDSLARARVVLLGETHDRPEDHRWQATVIAGLAAIIAATRLRHVRPTGEAQQAAEEQATP